LSRVTDGATLRQTRLLDIMRMINMAKGATMLEIQGYSWAVHGLKFDTTRTYVREASMGGFLKEDHGKFYVTDRYVRAKPRKGRHDM